jgi:hypothetical protein
MVGILTKGCGMYLWNLEGKLVDIKNRNQTTRYGGDK